MSTSAASPAAPRPARPARPARPPRPPRAAPAVRPALQRARECAVSGVSVGIARHLGAPVWAVRALFVVLAPFGGAGILLYLWCWAFMPGEAGESAPTRSWPVAWILLAVAAVAFAVALQTLGELANWGSAPALRARVLGAVVVAAASATAAGLWAGFVDRADTARGPRHAVWTRASAIVLLVGCLIAGVSVGGEPLATLIGTLVPTAGILLVLSSTLVERFRELSGERVKRIREEQRAEMAAHLHDSVLQTLALIQNRAGASSEAARLARAQERELRAWLYDGDQPADSDLATDLRDYAGALELDYPARIDVVSAGLSTERASGELAAAAREAMLNAARHAGGEVSVYIEGGPQGVDVFIRDRGAGFDVDAVPEDRLGIRQSIAGRMRRVGGAATVSSTPAGTEVHLHYATPAPSYGADRG
ncbi:MAG: PspC domain-containing protein [Microbacterium sp.]|uniref:ATP-binding protein n=1 Tax=Microbacterium sp. TaxID=51671 RepID=UPI001ACA981B|nr:ATP-binding protein [Microbacterium sp.]MBN9178580.1 PspC domain-containing protein [Microbacterium sp.]